LEIGPKVARIDGSPRQLDERKDERPDGQRDESLTAVLKIIREAIRLDERATG
jgi:hypothetical protein